MVAGDDHDDEHSIDFVLEDEEEDDFENKERDPPRSLKRVPPGTNYCTAYGYNCTEHEHIHDTHTRVMPHERRMNTMAADATIALICTFFAIDALGALTGESYAEPDWAADECPGLCSIGDVSDDWDETNWEWKMHSFDVDTSCPGAKQEWLDTFSYYLWTTACAGVFSLAGALMNAMVASSGGFLLYDAFDEKVLEMNLVDRFDRWWFLTWPPRVLVSRAILFIVPGAYIWSIHSHPQWICASSDFDDTKTKVMTVAYIGLAVTLGAMIWLKAVEKLLMWKGFCTRKIEGVDNWLTRCCGCRVSDCWSCCEDGTAIDETGGVFTKRFAKVSDKHIQTYYAQNIAKNTIGDSLTGKLTAANEKGNGWADMHQQLICKRQPTAGECLDDNRNPACSMAAI